MTSNPTPDDTRSVPSPSSPIEPAQQFLPHAEDMPRQIGPYKILQRLGEGGMGVVYLAEQSKPIHRRVALKIIKLGMDTKQVVARFEAEREALALMDHQNVARVFDAGATEKGRPYFVMEHVAGIPITDYCDKHRLNTAERLRLFMDVCHAVQHAHQKGIIHRDIKPSNVLVAVKEDHPIPKVIDFGVAKATQQRLTEQTLFTEQGQLIGTPGYMSPEQAEMTALDIDTRADIYSLGVLLYELLVGALPFDTESLRRAGLAEMQRIIREVQPPKPSTRLTSLGDASTAVAQRRHTEPRTLARQLRGDLDWIVMKCLEKDRTRRYDTADGLAQEIERYLKNEPVLAGPPSATYRLRKFARRRRIPIAITVGVLVLLGFAIDQRLRAGLARSVMRTRETAYSVFYAAQPDAALSNPGRVIADCTRAIALDPTLALAYALRAKAYTLTGDDAAAWNDCSIAIELDPDNAFARRTLGYLHLMRGEFEQARKAYDLGFQKFVTGTDLPRDLHNRARVHAVLGDYGGALAFHDGAVALAPKTSSVYLSRALTRRFAAKIEGALEDISQAELLDANKWALQCAMWRWEMLALRGEAGDREAAEAALDSAEKFANSPLKKDLLAVCRGASDGQAGLSAANTPELRCCVYYYLGAKAVVDGRRQQAREFFEKSVETGAHDLPEFDLARWHLSRLAAP